MIFEGNSFAGCFEPELSSLSQASHGHQDKSSERELPAAAKTLAGLSVGPETPLRHRVRLEGSPQFGKNPGKAKLAKKQDFTSGLAPSGATFRTVGDVSGVLIFDRSQMRHGMFNRTSNGRRSRSHSFQVIRVLTASRFSTCIIAQRNRGADQIW